MIILWLQVVSKVIYKVGLFIDRTLYGEPEVPLGLYYGYLPLYLYGHSTQTMELRFSAPLHCTPIPTLKNLANEMIQDQILLLAIEKAEDIHTFFRAS